MYIRERKRIAQHLERCIENAQKRTTSKLSRVKKKDVESVTQKQRGDENEKEIFLLKGKNILMQVKINANLDRQMDTGSKVMLIHRNFYE